ncbi:MAG TPA: hypothetical protein VIY72_09140 [Acidimicrobiales bacterium]
MSDTSQGPGWWQASDGKWYPPESAPGGGAAPGGASYGSGGGVDIGGAISYGWNKFTQNAGPLIVAILFIWVATIVLTVIGIPIGRGGLIVQLIWNIVVVVVSAVLSMGIVRMALAVVNGQTLEMSMAVPGGPMLVSYAITGILVGLMIGVGLVFCIIPGLIAAAFFLFAHFAVLDENLQPGDAIKRSIELVKPQFGSVFGFMIVAFLINLVGAILCGLGLLVTWPLTIVAGAYIYKGLKGESVAA